MTNEDIEKLARTFGSAYVNRHAPGVTSFGFTSEGLVAFARAARP